MIDTSRHFLPVSKLKKIIDSLMFTKMNVLHWHITDAESYPLKLDSYPEIAEASKYEKNSFYSKRDV